jgi:ATP-dependent Clp protease ATP-binding subunit ClpC
LTEKVRRKPYAVVLLDEIEKAHPEVFNILLQMLDDGQLTDSFGRKVDFRNTVVIMTSNMGTREARIGKSLGFAKDNVQTDYDKMKGKILDEMKRTFNPELINRIDETVIFHSLEKHHILAIVDILLRDIVKRMSSKAITLELRPEAKEFLADKGWDPNFGARPLRRSIQRYLEDPLAEEILRGERMNNINVIVSKDEIEGKLSFEVVPVPKKVGEEAEEPFTASK